MIAGRIAAPALGVLLALAAAGAAVQSWRLNSVQQTLASERLDRALQIQQLQAQALQATTDNQRLAQAMQTAVQEAQDAGRKERDRLARVAAADRAERDRLRDDIAAYAAGRGISTGDTLEACRARAAKLGRAVDDGLRIQADMAARFGDLAADYRTLYLSWPGATAPD